LDWGNLPQVQASPDEIMLDEQILSWYSFFLSKGVPSLFSEGLELIRKFPPKRNLVSPKDGLIPRSDLNPALYPLPVSINLIVGLFVERDLFLNKLILAKLYLGPFVIWPE
jgi:hypothetical protein